MGIDAEIAKTAITAAASVCTTLIAIFKWGWGVINSLDKKITLLSAAISQLDKNLAVQAAMFESHMNIHKGRTKNGNNRDT